LLYNLLFFTNSNVEIEFVVFIPFTDFMGKDIFYAVFYPDPYIAESVPEVMGFQLFICCSLVFLHLSYPIGII